MGTTNMKIQLIFVAIIALTASLVSADKYAVLVRGSSGYFNYRHEADVLHAYTLLINKGFPHENIILMTYGDIPNNSENPVKDNVINKPNGPNVWTAAKGHVAYNGSDVNPENFLAVLTGDASKTGGKPVLKSTSEDEVFIYFSDHGASGLIAFPVKFLYAHDLLAALQTMHTKGMYKRLVFYLEACESGSMFVNLPKNTNIFATTAANPDQSSYACYYDNQRQTYLGDLYSVNWLQDSDAANMQTETLAQQYQVVKKETNTSDVCQWGDATWDSSPIGDFQSYKSSSEPFVGAWSNGVEFVDSRDVKMATLESRVAANPSLENRKARDEELRHRMVVDRLFHDIMEQVHGANGGLETLMKRSHAEGLDTRSLKAMIQYVEKQCGRFSDYSLKYIHAFGSLVLEQVPFEQVKHAVDEHCYHSQRWA